MGYVAIHGSRTASVFFSFASALVWAALDIPAQSYSHWMIGLWNTVVRLSFFLVVSVILSRLRDHIEIEHTLATTDSLTGVANSRAFYALLQREVGRMKRSHAPLAVAYLDVDDFKAVNDRDGHPAGDELLCAVADRLAQNVRGVDTVARLGGDEFAILLPETGLEGARGVLERVRDELRRTFQSRSLTFSIGAVAVAWVPESVEDLVQAADELMYRVKKSGKNNLLVEPMGSSPDPSSKGSRSA